MAASKRPLTRESLRALVLARLPAEMQQEQPAEDDNLLDYGLDSLAVMGLVEEWRQQGLVVDLAELARTGEQKAGKRTPAQESHFLCTWMADSLKEKRFSRLVM
ncbi:DUF2913 family protein, partial [Aeromonas hydrophila]|uniref:DUF2913 family protein n=1 Tax=Aeromonas hydrophila TaxID=644 RepID=UPI0036DEC1C8